AQRQCVSGDPLTILSAWVCLWRNRGNAVPETKIYRFQDVAASLLGQSVEGIMRRFAVTASFEADDIAGETAVAGEVFHVARNSSGGAIQTLVARYFAWHQEFVEGFHRHWRVDCFVRQHQLSPEPFTLGEALVEALLREGICSKPIWVSAHR